MKNKPTIKEFVPSDERKIFHLSLDSAAIGKIKYLANLRGDSYGEIINDILCAFVDRNSSVFSDLEKSIFKTFDNIKW